MYDVSGKNEKTYKSSVLLSNVRDMCCDKRDVELDDVCNDNV